MFKEQYLVLKQIFPPDVLWEVRPQRMLGRVLRKDPKSMYIVPEIVISYPDGSLMFQIRSSEIEKFDKDDYVMFSMKDAKNNEKIEKGQPNLQLACNVEFATPEEMENYEEYFGYSKLYQFSSKLKELVQVSQADKDAIKEEYEERMNLFVRRRNEEFALRETTNSQKEIDLAVRENEIERKVMQMVSERLREFGDRESSLLASEEALSEKLAKISQKEKEVQGVIQSFLKEREAFAHAQKQFQRDKEAFDRLFLMLNADEKEPVSAIRNTLIPSDLPNGINKYLEQHGYSMSPSLTTQFLLTALCAGITGQFVVLSGPTGVGKTSMVNIFAEALGAGNGVVPVRPAWIDPTDLFGFYNPQQNRYQASPFMDRFLEAKQYSEANRLYFLTLDEMNLSRVENYAADFLSRLEKSRSGESEAYLSLYSRDIEQQLRIDVTKAKEEPDKDVKFIAYTINNLTKYPSNIKIPDGLILFGTINLDETTHHLSPKFLDRSFVINIPAQNLADQINKIANTGGKIESYFDFSLSALRDISKNHFSSSSDAQRIWDDLLFWQSNYIQPLGIKLGFRFSKMYITFMRVATELGIAPHAAASIFFKSKLLPWISFHKDEVADGHSTRSKLDILRYWAQDSRLSSYPKEYGLQNDLQRIVDRGSNLVVIQYLE